MVDKMADESRAEMLVKTAAITIVDSLFIYTISSIYRDLNIPYIFDSITDNK